MPGLENDAVEFAGETSTALPDVDTFCPQLKECESKATEYGSIAIIQLWS
jgi:hypothetical protein